MRIAFVYDCIYPYVKGGVERRIFELAKVLKKEHEVHIFGMHYWPGKAEQVRNGIHYHGVGKLEELYVKRRRKILPPIRYSLKLYKHLVGEKFDIVDVQSQPYFPGFAVKLAALKQRTPVIVTWHEYWGKYWFEYLGALGIFGFFIEKLLVISNKNRIVVSPGVQQRLPSSVLIPNGIDLKAINRIKPMRKKIDVLYVGRLIKEKNVDVLLKAVGIMKKRVTCTVIGDGPVLPELKELASNLNINVTFKKPTLSANQLFQHMKSSTCFVSPSSREGFGMTLLEAMACGSCVITVDEPENRGQDLVKGKGVVCKLSPDALAENILNVLEDAALRKNIHERSKKFVVDYDWDNIVKSLSEYYDQVRK